MAKSNNDTDTEILSIVHQFMTELDDNRRTQNITIHDNLLRDLGIDSIGKVDLLHRIEAHFNVQLSNQQVTSIETIQDLIKVIEQAAPKRKMQKQKIESFIEKTHIDPAKAQTLVDVLLLYAKTQPNRPHIYLQDENGIEEEITYGKLYNAALAGAAGLIKLGLKKDETVAIMLPTSAEFFYAFFAVLLAGGIPVPIYPPFRPDQIGEYAVREATILRNAEVRFLISFHQAEMLSRLLRVFISSLKAVVTMDELFKIDGKTPHIKTNRNDAALIQYTSGSTSAPKGVLLAHQNLLANIRAYGEAIKVVPSDVCVSWLPLYHDMGLIGKWLGSFYYGNPVCIMSPLNFLIRPERWLWAIHYHRGTISAGPNFAYELCIKKINDNDIEGLDLSSWRLAFNGAEAVNPNTLRRFYEKFKSYGLKEESIYPVYGLAESSVALTFPPLGQKPHFDRIQREPFEKNNKAIPATKNENNEKQLEFVGCGIALKGHEIRVVNDDNHILPERHVGKLQFRGPSSMQGYYRNSKATAAIYHDGWWDTGDLAYLVNGEVFIVGRKKDIIIKAGRNFYPEEIEEMVGQLQGIRKGCVVAFGVQDPESGTEKLIIVAETREQQKSKKNEIRKQVLDKVTTGLGVPPDHIVLVPPRTIPKTSSGKLRRSSCKADYISGKIGKSPIPSWIQYSQLLFIGGIKSIQQFLSVIGKGLYSIYLAIILAIFFIPIWLTIMLPQKKTARKMAKFWSRFILTIAFCPIHIRGKENLSDDKTAVYIANHASYIDAVVLSAVLPATTAIVAKAELAQTPLLKKLVKKLGHPLVERFEFTKSVEDAEKIQKQLSQGESIAIFPEGTFTYASGLRPFKLGAFKMAAETQNPICPISLKGTRKIMRTSIYLLRPSRIQVTISPCLQPQGKELQDISNLRKKSRNEIAKYCGEEMINL